MSGPTTAPPEDRERLVGERDFLLKSLDDLEDERAAGSIDDESYRQLHDDYTARAAAVIRTLRDGVDARPAPLRLPWSRRAIAIGLVVVFAVAAGLALAAALGARLPGQTGSGNSGPAVADPEDSAAARRQQLELAIEENPSDVAARLLLALELEVDNDLAGALAQYDAVIALDPNNSDAFSQSGRILYLTAVGSAPEEAAVFVEQSRVRLDRAIELDATNLEARFFRAIVLANEYQDFLGAQGDLQRYLAGEPNGRFAVQARQLLEDVVAALEGSTGSTVPQP